MYLEKMLFKSDYRCFKQNDEFVLYPLTLLVGDQGCGKSTILTCIRDKHKDVEFSLSPDTMAKGVDFFYFDSEHDNPRLKDPNLYSTVDGQNKGIGYASALTSRFKSHGEIMEVYTVKCLRNAKNALILIDEPESGLSLHNQFRLIEEIYSAIDRDCQLIISTHCYPLIKYTKEVFNVKDRLWELSSTFIDKQFSGISEKVKVE